MTRVLLIAGSSRRDSLNARLLDAFEATLAGRVALDRITPAQARLPLFDQDLESSAEVQAAVASLHERFAACDGLIVASPEHNGQVSAYLKNLVDWVSRLPSLDPCVANPFLDKPLLLCSASTGWSGGALGLSNARALFAYVGCVVIGDAVMVPHAGSAWDADGCLLDPFLGEHIQATSQKLLQLTASRAPIEA